MRTTPNLVVYIGQSLNGQPVGHNYPDTTMTGLRGVSYLNAFIAGVAWLQFKRTQDWFNYFNYFATQARRVVYVMVGGTTDYSTTANRTGAQCYADQGTIATNLRALGSAGQVKVISTTTHPSGPFPAPNEANRVAGNSLVMGDASAYFDAVFDAAQAPLNDPANTTYYQGDQTHGTAAWADQMAAWMRPVITPFLIG